MSMLLANSHNPNGLIEWIRALLVVGLFVGAALAAIFAVVWVVRVRMRGRA